LQWVLNLQEQAHWLWLFTLIIGGVSVIWETAKGIARKQFASDIVATLAIIAAIALNDAFPGVVIVLMQTGGRALEDYAFRRAESSLDTLLTQSPRIAHRRIDDSFEDVSVQEVKVNDLLLVKPGDLVPVDGILVKGPSQLDESSLTGEPLPKQKAEGDIVYSGTINVGSIFEMKAEKQSGESQYAKIVDLVRKAQQEKAPIQRLADKYAVWFTPITLAMCGIGWLITHETQTILSVLVVATPCSLIFATPVAIISGINRAMKNGIVVKNGAAMEQMGKAQVVVFDKTGTITRGIPVVENVLSFDTSQSSDKLLYLASSIEQFSSHPAAEALVLKGKERFGRLGAPKNFREIPGAGVEGILNGNLVRIGSGRIFNEDLNKDKHIDELIKKIKSEGRMLAFVGINEKVIGAIIFGDSMRSGVDLMVKDLHSMGIKQTVMMTGDNKENAQAIARQAGLGNFESNLLPEEKVASIKKLKEKYHNVMMVGDGINDAFALASSTVGLAMGAKGTAISADAADAVLLVDDVTKVANAISISQRTLGIAKQSILVGLGSSIILMAISTTGIIPPALGALLQEALDLAVILNALRAR
jgi:heavy metal translocating P-type ATPase